MDREAVVVRCFPADDEECRCECVERLNHLISPKIGESVDGRWDIQLQLCTQITPKAAVATKFRIDDSDPKDQSRTSVPPSPSFLPKLSTSINTVSKSLTFPLLPTIRSRFRNTSYLAIDLFTPFPLLVQRPDLRIRSFLKNNFNSSA